MAARSSLLQTPGQVFIETLTFGHIFVRKWTKSFPLQGEFDPTLRALHLDPAGGSAADPRLGSRSTRSPWSASHPLGKSWIRHCAKAIPLDEKQKCLQVSTQRSTSGLTEAAITSMLPIAVFEVYSPVVSCDCELELLYQLYRPKRHGLLLNRHE